MRIIAQEKDYYDCIRAHGQDQTLLYIRQPEEVFFKHSQWPFPGLFDSWPFPGLFDSWWFSNYRIAQHIIGFCGKIYAMIELSIWDYGMKKPNDIMKKPNDIKQCFTIDDVDTFVEENLTPNQKKSYRGKTTRWWRGGGKRRIEFAKFFENCQKRQDAFTDHFIERRCPVFVAIFPQNSHIIYNALLYPYGFVKVFDPYTAFQEIAMFMGSMAMPEKDMPIVPDELKIQKRGFDKWSFRRPPAG